MKPYLLFLLLLIPVTIVAANNPDQSAVTFNLKFKMGVPLGDVWKQEDKFTKDTRFSAIYRDSLGNRDTVLYTYQLYSYSFETEIAYFLIDQLSIGLNYNYQVVEDQLSLDANKYNYDKTSVKLLKTNSIGPTIEYWLTLNDFLKLSFELPLQYSFGTLNRFPIIYRAISLHPTSDVMFNSIIIEANKNLNVNGFKISPTVNFRIFAGDLIFFNLSGRYEFEELYIGKDVIAGYPDKLTNHNILFAIGIGLLTNTFN
jgi:hypothetical protein